MVRRLTLLLSLLALPLWADQDPGTRFAVAIESSDVATIKEMLASGISTETTIEYGEHKITPLIKAAWDGEEEIVNILLASGAKVNANATDTGETALMNAVTRGHIPIVRILIKAGADVSPKNKFDFNAFTSAVAAGNQEIAGLLLDAGAKVEAGASGLTPLQFAASSGNIEMIRFLVKRGANVNHGAKTGGQTALLSAIYGAHPEAVQALVDLKADVSAKTSDGTTPLKAAQKGDQDDIVKILKAAGAKK
ncbi:MAG TPA: ankyrin repeat domain-containing protein [Thermoanaerobaculia bacterium]|nr:ankyrin repeat domain-containing protein [Thermoanaerobaculia bacterium]